MGEKVGKRLSGLDGIRAVAVLMVVVGHASKFPQFPAVVRDLLVLDIARFGVTIFFVLSGFLITTLLLDERARTGRVSLRDFYLRRTVRIFPAAYLYIASASLAALAGWVALAPGDVLHAVTYTMNYHHDRAWTLGHLWSLAVEEQFYLLWPLAFLLAGRRAIHVAVSIVVLVPAVRVLAWVLFPAERTGIDEEFQYVADALATGCLMALLVDRFGAETLAGRMPRWLPLAGAVAAVAAAAFSEWPSFFLPLGTTIVDVGIALCIFGAAYRPAAGVDRVLNSRIAVFVGMISYSLYLWQQMFLSRDLGLAHGRLPLAIALSFLAAAASYFMLEKPLLGLRERFRH